MGSHHYLDVEVGAASPSHAFMSFTYPVRPDKRRRIPAVVHADHHTRGQLVTAEHNPKYHALIRGFYQHTGVPTVLTPTLFVPHADGFTLRALDSGAFPWFPAALTMVWSFVIITSTVISRVIYGLRAEVREAKKLGQYVLEEKIGEGAFGEVFRAWDSRLDREVALKLLKHRAADPDALPSSIIEEGRLLARVRLPAWDREIVFDIRPYEIRTFRIPRDPSGEVVEADLLERPAAT